MSELIPELPAGVAIQGPRVLAYMGKTAESARFRLLGFEDPVVHIVDHRRDSLKALDKIAEPGEVKKFVRHFNVPANVTIWAPNPGEIQIDLKETQETDPDYMLWIAVGMEGDLPAYEYIYRDIAPMEKESAYALLSVYERPRHEWKDNQRSEAFSSLRSGS